MMEAQLRRLEDDLIRHLRTLHSFGLVDESISTPTTFHLLALEVEEYDSNRIEGAYLEADAIARSWQSQDPVGAKEVRSLLTRARNFLIDRNGFELALAGLPAVVRASDPQIGHNGLNRPVAVGGNRVDHQINGADVSALPKQGKPLSMAAIASAVVLVALTGFVVVWRPRSNGSPQTNPKVSQLRVKSDSQTSSTSTDEKAEMLANKSSMLVTRAFNYHNEFVSKIVRASGRERAELEANKTKALKDCESALAAVEEALNLKPLSPEARANLLNDKACALAFLKRPAKRARIEAYEAANALPLSNESRAIILKNMNVLRVLRIWEP